MLTEEQIKHMHAMAIMTVGPWGDDMQLLIADIDALKAQVTELQAKLSEMTTDRNIVCRDTATLKAQVAELERSREQVDFEDEFGNNYKVCGVCGAPYPWEKAVSSEVYLKLVKEKEAITAKLAQALAVCNEDLTRMQALTAERDAAIKAACELFAFDEQAHEHWLQYTAPTRELLIRQTDAALGAAGTLIRTCGACIQWRGMRQRHCRACWKSQERVGR